MLWRSFPETRPIFEPGIGIGIGTDNEIGEYFPLSVVFTRGCPAPFLTPSY